MSKTALFIAFNAGVLAVLAIDLGIFNKKAHAASVKEAATWSAVWIALSLGFAGLILSLYGKDSALEFVTGYLIEYSLSIAVATSAATAPTTAATTWTTRTLTSFANFARLAAFSTLRSIRGLIALIGASTDRLARLTLAAIFAARL